MSNTLVIKLLEDTLQMCLDKAKSPHARLVLMGAVISGLVDSIAGEHRSNAGTLINNIIDKSIAEMTKGEPKSERKES